MMTENFEAQPLGILRWQQANVRFFAIAGTVAWVLVSLLGIRFLELPVMPISIVGAVIGIFVAFRANQSYDRWWEGRKLWGRLINTSRHWCNQSIHLTDSADREVAERMVKRHVVYVHVLRCLLRKQDPYRDQDARRHMTEADTALEGSTNLTHALLDAQMAELAALSNAGRLAGHRLEVMDRTLMDLLNIQGGCERIKGTPLPRGVGFIAEMLIRIFSIMLPFAMAPELGIMVIPMNVLVCMAFALISEAGRVLEDPFNMFYNGLPLNALSIKIERNLLERLGTDELPPAVREAPFGVLM